MGVEVHWPSASLVIEKTSTTKAFIKIFTIPCTNHNKENPTQNTTHKKVELSSNENPKPCVLQNLHKKNH